MTELIGGLLLLGLVALGLVVMVGAIKIKFIQKAFGCFFAALFGLLLLPALGAALLSVLLGGSCAGGSGGPPTLPFSLQALGIGYLAFLGLACGAFLIGLWKEESK